MLTQNNIAELADLDALQGFPKLTHVSLVENPVASKEVCHTRSSPSDRQLTLQKYYRYYLLWRCPQIRFLDFQKVKDAEREKGKELFGDFDTPTDLARSIIAVRSKNSGAMLATPTINGTGKNKKLKISDSEKKRFESLVKKATTLSEVQKLEKAYSEGRLPPGIADEDAMDET